MTFIHAAACTVFCFGPCVAIYKATSLSDQSGTSWLMCLAALFYLLNLFAKSLLVASFLPAATCESSLLCSGAVAVITAVMETNSINYFLSHKTSLSYAAEARVLCIGLGWALGHIVCSNGNLLLKAVGSAAFQWADVYHSIQASLAPISYLSATALAFIASRRRMPRASRFGCFALAALLIPGSLMEKHLLGLSDPEKTFLAEEITPLCWAVLALHAAVAASAGVATYLAFRSGQQKAQSQKSD